MGGNALSGFDTETTPGREEWFHCSASSFADAGTGGEKKAVKTVIGVTNGLDWHPGRNLFGEDSPYAPCPAQCITPRNLLHGPTASLYWTAITREI
jgi:hypothetical protein